MPQQRDPNKKMIRFWIDTKAIEEFKLYASHKGTNMSELLIAYVYKCIEREKPTR